MAKRVFTDFPEVIEEEELKDFFLSIIGYQHLHSRQVKSSILNVKGKFPNGRSSAKLIRFDNYEYNWGYIDHLLVFNNKDVIEGIAKVTNPVIDNVKSATYVVMTYNKKYDVFVREDYFITAKKDDAKKAGFVIYAKHELYEKSVAYMQEAKRNPKFENKLRDYRYLCTEILPKLQAQTKE